MRAAMQISTRGDGIIQRTHLGVIGLWGSRLVFPPIPWSSTALEELCDRFWSLLSDKQRSDIKAFVEAFWQCQNQHDLIKVRHPFDFGFLLADC